MPYLLHTYKNTEYTEIHKNQTINDNYNCS